MRTASRDLIAQQAGDRSQTIAASARNPDPAAAGIVPTTSSSRNLNSRPRTRTRRQTQNTNEPCSIFLVVASSIVNEERSVRYNECSDSRLDHRNVPPVQRQRYFASHFLLRPVNERIQRFTQGRKPKSEINQFGILQANVLLEMRDVALQAQRFQFAMSRDEQRATNGIS